MKIILPVFCLALFVASVSYSQSCLPGGLTLTTQAEVNGFPASNPGCVTIIGNVQIQGANITNLNGLSAIRQIDGDLTISNNTSLVSITGLGNLRSIGGAVRIQGNTVLPTFQGLDSLRAVRGDFMYISNNTALTDINDLHSLDTVQGIFQIWDCDNLSNLAGLENLKYVGDDLALFRNDNLTNLNGLNGLARIGNGLRIYENPLLTDLSALNHPINIEGPLVITDNPLLSVCNVAAVCNYLAAPPSFSAFSNNADGCNSAAQVMTACVATDTREAAQAAIALFPNPATDMLQVRSGDFRVERLSIRDSNGRLVYREAGAPDAIYIGHLPAGVYWVELAFHTGNILTQRLVKL